MNTDVKERISAIFVSCRIKQHISPTVCARRVRMRQKKLRRCCHSSDKYNFSSDMLTLLHENYYLLEREDKTILLDLSGFSRNDHILFLDGAPALCRIFDIFFGSAAACKDNLGSSGITEKQVLTILSAASELFELSSAELRFAPIALRMTLTDCACTSFLHDSPDATDNARYASKALHDLYMIDFAEIASSVSPSERLLMQDPAKIYPIMDDSSRSYYRWLLAERAKREHITETAAAAELLQYAHDADNEKERHIGFRLLLEKRSYTIRGTLAIALPPVLSAAMCIAMGILLNSTAVLLAFLPLWETLRTFSEWLLTADIPAAVIPAIDLKRANCTDCKTVAVISTLMPKVSDVPELAAHLKRLYLANEVPGLTFCVLADFKESSSPCQPDDDAKLSALSHAIASLNAEFDGHFSAFVRERSYSKTQGSYCGRERKRGAITELARYISSGKLSDGCRVIPYDCALHGKKYMIILDSDTRLLFDTAEKLIGAAMHPLNRPVIDTDRNIVTEGYGVFAPRMSVSLKSSGRTLFSHLMAGCGGITPYEVRTKEIYQDTFGSSLFCGKGIIDIHAFLQVMDGRLPHERILSHDIAEGEYLRTAFLSGVELAESFPETAASWQKRLHRWIRGDWQNLFLITRNELPLLSKYKLFDNLRRELTPVFSLICIVASAILTFGGTHKTAVITALAAALPIAAFPFVSALLAFINGGLFAITRRYFSDIIPQAIENLLRAVFSFIQLPSTAATSIDAVVRALWRSFVSKKQLLQWVTAADSASDNNLAGYIRRSLPAVLLGVILTISPLPLLRLYGICFLLSLPVDALTSRKRPENTHRLSENDREYIHDCAASMWNFFEEYSGQRDNWLPPDNVQQAPVYNIAHRTSPTNIGLGMLSTLAARDFDLIDTDCMCRRLTRMISTVEKLEKWHGNLYNWYSTETLSVLCPRFVSAVDSGNFVCCLVALLEGLRDYSYESPSIAPLIERIGRIVEETQLEHFYDPKRRLFSIGFDAETENFSTSYYDFLMSESRMTSYYAIASRRVEKRHWAALSRIMSRSGGYAGPVSWTGTMFEYYMPALLLPDSDGSLLSEGLRYSYYCQRKRVRKGMPWGISESAFYSFDSQLCYRYKAHGVQKLGVKRGLDSELVISPYSSFLTLPFYPKSSIKNLRLLQKWGMYSSCGFFEAIDLTHGRSGICRSYMSHHIGMSIAACANAAFGGIMQRRFMSNARMASAAELLEERPDRDAVVFDGTLSRNVNEPLTIKRENIGGNTGMISESETLPVNPNSPRTLILSNGELCDILSDTGENRLMLAQADLTRRTTDSILSPQGIFVFVSNGKNFFSLTEAPFYNHDVNYETQMEHDRIKYLCRTSMFSCAVEVSVHDHSAIEQRLISLKNLTQTKQELDILIYFEPVLRVHRDHNAHPAFSKLFLRAHHDSSSNCTVFSRKSRGDERELHMAAGFLEDVEYKLETRREKIFSAPCGFDALKKFQEIPFEGGSGIPDCCFAAKLHLTLSPGAHSSYTFCISAASGMEQCIAEIIRLRCSGGIISGRCAAASPISGDSPENRAASALLPHLIFPSISPDTDRLARQNQLGIDGLWSLSISGDFPIVGCHLNDDAEQSLEQLCVCVKALRLLRECRVEFDLAVFFSSSQLNDFQPKALSAIASLGCAELVNSRAGVFLIDTDTLSNEQLTLLKLSVICYIGSSIYHKKIDRHFERPVNLLPVQPADIEKIDAHLQTCAGVFTKQRFYAKRGTPLPFCHLLASPSFGTVVSDHSLGFSWAVNSRENKLTPWSNDFAQDNRGEIIAMRSGDKIYNLTHGALFSCSTDNARWEGHTNDIKTRIETFLSEKGAGHCKFIDTVLTNLTENEKTIEIAFYTQPVIGSTQNSGRYIKSDFLNGTLLLQNPMNLDIPGFMALSCDYESQVLLDRNAFFAGNWNASGRGSELCAALIVPLKLPPKRDIHIRFILTFAADKAAALLLAQCSDKLTKKSLSPPVPFEIFTPDEQLNAFINGWCIHQARSGRIFARTSFWQNGGAYGFRDQLQDAFCIAPFDPILLRRQIFRACAVQFTQGDVLHWWHRYPKKLCGVRTRISDDLLWLPFAVCEYIEKTDDKSILDADIAYLEGKELAFDERERYFEPARSTVRESVYHHCLRAIERARQFGSHGIPLIGSGDWNDSFSSVGSLGQGESVWLAMFLRITALRFADISRKHGCNYDAEALETLADEMKQTVETHCWDGEWYLRAFFDSGSPMGSHSSAECRIDSLTQSFAALSDISDNPQRIDGALDHACAALIDHKMHMVRLFDPPFENSTENPGYVKSYPPGIRENGGQYTHAAIWLAMALLKRSRSDEGYRILDFINPVSRCSNYELNQKYLLEPYYIAADIYSGECSGRGGWSLYTGAAGWYLKTVWEYLLGIQLRQGEIYLRPSIPESWNGFKARIFSIEISVTRTGQPQLRVDGNNAEYVPLDGRPHTVDLYL